MMMLKHAMLVGTLAAGLLAVGGMAPVQAQSAVCERLGTLLKQREGIMKRINGMGKKNVNPATACTLFGNLASNGTQTIAFATENKDWCQIPDVFLENLNQSQKQITTVRGQACRAAQQRVALERRARQQQQAQQQGGANSFGGVDGFSGGPWRVPQGAL